MIFISKEKNNTTDTENKAINIRSIQADSIYRVNNGYENAFLDCGKAVIPYSLFSEYMKKHGMTVNTSKRMKSGWTSDFIVMKYDYKIKAQSVGDKQFKEISSGELREHFYMHFTALSGRDSVLERPLYENQRHILQSSI